MSANSIAVLSEAGFPRVACTDLDPEALLAKLLHFGFEAALVSVDQMSKPEALSQENYAAFVNCYGDAFPAALIEPLRAFRQSGGVFVSTGVPLKVPVTRSESGWAMEPETERFGGEDAAGLGTGRTRVRYCTSYSPEVRPTVLGRRLGLDRIDWSSLVQTDPLFTLDAGSPPEGTRVETILEADETGPFSAVTFRPTGGADIWAATSDFVGMPRISACFLGEVVVRALVWTLSELGLASEEKVARVIDAEIDPEVQKIRTQGFAPIRRQKLPDRVFPPVGDAPETLRWLDLEGLSPEERILAASAQGLLNREPCRREKIFLIWREKDRDWLDWLVSEKYVHSASPIDGLAQLIDILPERNAVVADDRPHHLPDIATTIAGCEGLLLVLSDELLQKYALAPTLDLRGRWTTNLEAYDWVLEVYGDRISRGVLACYAPTATHGPLRDYLVGASVFTFWVSGFEDTHTPGSDQRAEENYFYERLARDFPVNIPVLGFSYAGRGIGVNEHGGVTLFSQTGKFHVVSDWLANLSVFTSMRPRRALPESTASESQGVPMARCDPDRYYASLVFTDGDNLCTWTDYFPDFWTNLGEHDFPVGWTMGPAVHDLLPPVLDYALANRPAGDTIGAGVSGIGYISAQQYGRLFGDNRQDVLEQYLQWTAQYMQRTDQHFAWIMRYGGPGSPELESYCRVLGEAGVEAIAGGYGKETPHVERSAEMMHNVAAFHCPTDLEDVAGQVRQIIRTHRPPLFLHLNIHNWPTNAENLRKLVVDLRGMGVELLTPEDMAARFRGRTC